MLALDLDLGRSLRTELSLWQQEAQLLGRNIVKELGLDRPKERPTINRPRLDPAAGAALLELPLAAAAELLSGFDRARYDLDVKRLQARELPFFQDAGACGTCGRQGLSDAAWVDFLSYVQFKALSIQALGARASDNAVGDAYDFLHRDSLALMASEEGEGEADQQEVAGSGATATASQGGEPPSQIARIKQRTGELLLTWLEERGPLTAPEREALALRSPQLDVIRVGVRAILRALQSLGFVASARVALFGLSLDEFENHEVWVRGEPAFIKVWLDTPVSLQAAGVLQAEEGFSQDFVFQILRAYLARCGVACSTFRRFPSMNQPQLIAEQFTVKCSAPTSEFPSEEELRVLARLPPFALDTCPGPDATACY